MHFRRSSVEWLTASSDVVAQGTIVDLSYVDIPIPNAPSSAPNFRWVTITLKVQAALKGKAPERVSFVIMGQYGDKSLLAWKQSGRPMVWFLNKGKPAPDVELPATEPSPTAETLFSHGTTYLSETVIPLALPGEKKIPWPCMAMDLTFLDEEGAVLAAIKAEAAREDPQKRSESASFELPAARTHGRFPLTTLIVPVNAYLEKCARQWAVGAADFLKPPADWHPKDEAERRRDEMYLQEQIRQLRCESIAALRFFKSKENIALLKTLLTDEAHVVLRDKDGGAAQWDYYVRRAAAAVLTEWKVEFGKPVLQGPAAN